MGLAAHRLGKFGLFISPKDYSDDRFFAIVANETLYLKADAEGAISSREAAGNPSRFSYKDGSTKTMSG